MQFPLVSKALQSYNKSWWLAKAYECVTLLLNGKSGAKARNRSRNRPALHFIIKLMLSQSNFVFTSEVEMSLLTICCSRIYSYSPRTPAAVKIVSILAAGYRSNVWTSPDLGWFIIRILLVLCSNVFFLLTAEQKT